MTKQNRPIHVITLEIVNDMQREYREDLQKYESGERKSKPDGSQMGAMLSMSDINEDYGWDSGKYVVACGLGNLQTWKGAKAREIKKELNAMLK